MQLGKKLSKTPRKIRNLKNKNLRYNNIGQVKIIKMKVSLKFAHFTDL